MPAINRGTLPQNFLDSVTAGVRLPQPEPQYLFAKAAIAAQLSLDAIDAGASTIQQFVTMMGAGGTVPPDLDALARAGDMYPDAVMAVNDFGLGMGDTVKLRRNVYGGGGYSEASRIVSADVPTSTTGLAIAMEEVPLVLAEFEGPFGASTVQPYAIRDFDAKYKAARDSLASLVTHHLRRDYVKWLDTVIRDRFRATTNITYSDAVANVLSFTATAGHVSNLEMIANARKAVSDREWAPFANGRYMCLVPTKFNVDMIGDVDWRELSKAHMPGMGGNKNLLFGYITSYQDVDFFECTTLKSYAAGDTVPGDGNAVPTSATVYEALLFGPGAVGMGTGMKPAAFWADDTDYGKAAKVIWRSIQGFQTLDSRGVQRILFQ